MDAEAPPVDLSQHAAPITSPKKDPLNDLERRFVLLVVVGAVLAVPLSDMSREQRQLHLKNRLIKQSFEKLKKEQPSPFPEGIDLFRIEKELGGYTGSQAIERFNELKLLLRDKLPEVWEMVDKNFDTHSNNWKRGIQLAEVFDRIFAAVWDKAEEARLAKLSPSAKAKTRECRVWSHDRAKPNWAACFRYYWWPPSNPSPSSVPLPYLSPMETNYIFPIEKKDPPPPAFSI